jgi:hypothetical protein
MIHRYDVTEKNVTVQVPSITSCNQLIIPLLFSILDPQDLCKFDVIEPALPIGKRTAEQSINLYISICLSYTCIPSPTPEDSPPNPPSYPLARLDVSSSP